VIRTEASPTPCPSAGLYHRVRIAIATFTMSLSVVSVADAELLFDVPVYYGSGSFPNSVKLADIDRDGDADAIICGTSSNLVTIYRNTGNGTLGSRADYTVSSPVYATVGDFDGDLWPDVAVAGWSGQVTILLRPGQGSPSIVNLDVGNNPRSIVAFDLEGDGDQDLAVTRYGNATVAILKNTGGVFTLDASHSARPGKSIRSADLDGDGRRDLIVGSHEGYVTILRQTGTGGFSRTDLNAGGTVSMAITADLNGDGSLDLATANENNTASVLLNLGNGTFAPVVTYPIGTLAQSLTAGDLDRDGDEDLAVANFVQNNVAILLNSGTGTFPQTQTATVGDRPRDVDTVDLNGDGFLDLATSNDMTPGSIAVAMNRMLPVDEGFHDAVSYPTGTVPYAISLADLDRDGSPEAITSCAVSRTVAVSRNHGDGTFANRVEYPAGLAVHTAVGDFDGDLWPDIAVADWDGTIRILRFANGNLVSSTSIPLTGNPRAIVTKDLDSDGDLDLAVARHGAPDVAMLWNTGGSFSFSGAYAVPQPKSVTAADLDSDGVPEVISGSPQGSVSILKRSASGSYNVTTLTMGSLVSMVAAADLNGDGHRDLATANESSTASVRLNTGGGAFASPVDYPIGALAQSLDVGDVDADGDPDLVVVSYTTAKARVLFNQGGLFAASLDYSTAGSARGVAVADVNRDGAVDLAAANETNSGSFAILINKGRGGIALAPQSGSEGTTVHIRGFDLTGASQVWFASTPATFAVLADTLIETQVPVGARTGSVRVQVPSRQIHGPVFVVAPALVSFLPTGGTEAVAVTLNGYNFTTVDSVWFNGTPAPFTIVSDAQIQTTVPVGATTGPIAVRNPGGTTLSAEPFRVASVPLIYSFVPGGGAPSTVVTLRGRFFTDATEVGFNHAVATFSVVSDSVALTTVPSGARTGLIHITTPEGTGHTATPFVVAPEIAHFRPRALTGDTISILGRNFVGTTTVHFAGVSATFNVASDSVLIAVVPAAAIQGPVAVTNAGGTTSSTVLFNPAYIPIVSSVIPMGGAPGAQITIRGLHFLEVVSVSFVNATAAFAIVSDSAIVSTVPAGARTGPLSVSTPFGTGLSAAFTVAPRITHHSPSAVPGDTVTILGDNFGGTTQVAFNGVAALFDIFSEQLIQAMVPDLATDGPLTVTNPGGTGVSANAFVVAPSTRGINLSWDECGSAGDSLKTFACDTNTGADYLVATFIPPRGIQRFVGISADLRIGSTSLPDWWKHGPGQCRSPGSLGTEFDGFGETCAIAWPGSQVSGFSYELGSYGANTARLRVQAAVPSEEAFALVDGLEYYAFRVRIGRAKTTGAGSCAGCTQPVRVRLENIQLFQQAAAARDPNLDMPLHGVNAYWQGIVGTSPQVASLSPGAGAPGSGVTIHGSGFAAASSVRFGNTEATFAPLSDTQLNATVPAAARTGPVHVTTPFGSATSGGDFVVAPRIAYFLPEQGPEGSEVTIFGHNFATVSAVTFNGLSAAFEVQADTSIIATVPTGAGEGPIVATNPGGVFASPEPFRVGTSAGVFNLSWDECGLAGNELKTFACNTNSGPPFALVASFAPPANVTNVTALSAEIRVSSPVLPDWWKFGPTGCRPITQVTAATNFSTDGACSGLLLSGGAVGNTVGFTAEYYGPETARLSVMVSLSVPLTQALDPTQEYYGFRLNIGRQRTVSDGSCANCDRPVAVKLESIRLLRGEGTEDVDITSPFRRATALWQGVPQPPPDLRSFTPLGGDIGTQVDLHGVRFTGVRSVRFGAVESEFTVHSDVLITARVPEDATTSRIQVENVHGSDLSDRSFVYAPDIRDLGADPSSIESREIPKVLALDRVAWDAGANGLAVTVALPQDGSAGVELFDVSGRRVVGQRLDHLGAGTHEIVLEPASPLPSGVHFVRLSLNGKAVSRRFVVVK
jgi:FG-GAP-like repeat/IPT/TIG domain